MVRTPMMIFLHRLGNLIVVITFSALLTALFQCGLLEWLPRTASQVTKSLQSGLGRNFTEKNESQLIPTAEGAIPKPPLAQALKSQSSRLSQSKSANVANSTYKGKKEQPSSKKVSSTTGKKNAQRPFAQVAWCILDSNNTWSFGHFPHASQSLFPCWSYFESMREVNPNVSCGFWLRNWTLAYARTAWHGALITAMNCLQTTVPPKFANQHVHRYNFGGRNMTDRGRSLTDKNTTRPAIFHWFERPSDAWTLRNVVLKHYNLTVTPRPRPIPTTDRLHIGFVQRKSSARRVILNMNDIVKALHQVFPNAMITNTTLDGMNLGEQAQYFASQDILIAAHGASLTNCAFLQPGSLVVQLYPKHYYPINFFGLLIHEVQSFGYNWYDGHPADVLQDHDTHKSQRFEFRGVDMLPSVEEIVGIVVNATQEINLLKG